MFDAIICKRDFPSDPESRPEERDRIFGPLLGATRLKSGAIAIGPYSLVTRFEDPHSILFPTNHPRHPEMRHEWIAGVVQGDTIVPGGPVKPEDIGNHAVLLGILKK